MKKLYIEPTTQLIKLNIQNVMQATSQMSVGADMSSGSGDSRRGNNFWEDEE